MPMFARGCIVLILISAWACTTATQTLKDGARLYGGEPRAVSDVAILEQWEEPELWLAKIDGKSRSYGLEKVDWNTWGGGRKGIFVELLPGEHTLEFGYYVNSGYQAESATRRQVVVFTAKPGTLYRAHANRVGSNWAASVREDGPIPQGFKRPKTVAVPK